MDFTVRVPIEHDQAARRDRQLCARLFENLGDTKLEQVESVEAPGVTHIRYARA